MNNRSCLIMAKFCVHKTPNSQGSVSMYRGRTNGLRRNYTMAYQRSLIKCRLEGWGLRGTVLDTE